MLKIIIIGVTSLILFLVITVILFIKFAPQIGQKPIDEHFEQIKKSPNHDGEKFINKIKTKEASLSVALATIPDFIFGKNLSPKEVIKTDFPNNFKNYDSLLHITWYGHSAFLIETNGKRILIDPMFGSSASPIYITTKRFNNSQKIDIDFFKDIDAVVISHDHYDHLDYPTISKIKNEVKRFYTPLGVGSHLKYWGVESEKITELDWWESAQFGDINLIACPARHFSGREFTDRFATLWASWIIKTENHNLYFSGDGGYGPHFKEIGDKFGPFDLAMMECGQYNEAWKDIHMMPEESVRAGIDVNANLMMPIHWAAFQLSIHSWQEPAERFLTKANELELNTIFPRIGQRFELKSIETKLPWWK